MSSQKFDVGAAKLDETASAEMKQSKKIVVCQDSVDNSTSQITWLHSKKIWKTTAEITLNIANNFCSLSSDLIELCEGFKNL